MSTEKTHLVHEEVEEKGESRRKESLKDLILGYLCAFAAAICMTITSAMVQILKESVSSVQIMAVTSIILALLAGLYLMILRKSPRIDLHDGTMPIVAIAVMLDIFAFILDLEASKFINVGQVGALHKATVLLVSIILSKVLLHEDINAVKLTAFVINMTGLIILILPIFVPNHGNVGSPNSIEDKNLSQIKSSVNTQISLQNDTDAYVQTLFLVNSSANNCTFQIEHTVTTSLSLIIGYLVIFFGGLFNGVELILISGYIQHIPLPVLYFWFGVIGVIICGLILIYIVPPSFPSDPVTIVLMMAAGLFSALANIFYIGTLYYLSAAKAALSQCIHIVLAVLFQYTLMTSFNYEDSNLPLWSMCPGVVLVLIGVLTVPASDIIMQSIYDK